MAWDKRPEVPRGRALGPSAAIEFQAIGCVLCLLNRPASAGSVGAVRLSHGCSERTGNSFVSFCVGWAASCDANVRVRLCARESPLLKRGCAD